MKREVVTDYIGHCADCGKKCYATRKQAKKSAKLLFPDDHQPAYRCGDYWHFGHLPYLVRRGAQGRG